MVRNKKLNQMLSHPFYLHALIFKSPNLPFLKRGNDIVLFNLVLHPPSDYENINSGERFGLRSGAALLAGSRFVSHHFK